MTTTTANSHYWAITAIGADTPAHRAGTAATRTETWTHALAAGRAALLAGELATLAVTVDDEHPSALYDPARDSCGALDPAQVTAALVEIHQAVTAGDLAAQLVGGLVSDSSGNGGGVLGARLTAGDDPSRSPDTRAAGTSTTSCRPQRTL
ncbi:MAG: hypothetical protein GEV09_13990 [Pseudonocardiaceae bacterium]|nr:hypothetical protein [Pseudonocardiaceae bacterium]